jgi:hypothetical protein
MFFLHGAQGAHPLSSIASTIATFFQLGTHRRNYIGDSLVDFFDTVGYSLFPYALGMIL